MHRASIARVVRFLVDQTIKTAHRPSRILTILGYFFFQHDWPTAAWWCLKSSLRFGRPPIGEYLLAANCLYHGLGRFRDAVALLGRANESNLKEAQRLGLADTPLRVLDGVWTNHIGHTAEIDYVIKLGILEGRKRDDTILYVPPGNRVANRFLLQQMAKQLRLIEDPAELPFPASAVQALHYDLLGPRLPDKTTTYFWKIGGKTYTRWDQEGRQPLFSFPPDVEARGWEALRKAGMPQGAWFVALHVREGKWDGRNSGMHAVRNADVSTYFPAIAEIVGRGGWVVRMGDPGMTTLPPMPNVIDYCHSAMRTDWMDVFIVARSRFMIGTNSGPAFIPALYGVPSVLTNWWPHGERPWQATDVFIPKLLRSVTSERYLTMSEFLREPFSFCHSSRYLADRGVKVEDNDPAVIKAAVAEMLERHGGDFAVSTEVADLRARADQIYESNGVVGMSQLASEFCQRYSHLFR
jgi:putative glycosyltransferase (TIGR04372 family)